MIFWLIDGKGGANAVIRLPMGRLGAEALVAHQILNALAGLAFMTQLDVAGAKSIRIGQTAWGAVAPDPESFIRGW